LNLVTRLSDAGLRAYSDALAWQIDGGAGIEPAEAPLIGHALAVAGGRVHVAYGPSKLHWTRAAGNAGRAARPGVFWAIVFGIIPGAIVVATFISGTAARIWAAYHSNREDITSLATFGTVIGAAIVAVTTLMRHFAQTEADRQRRIVESFSKAVEQLGSEKLDVRVGAIFALERLSKESNDDYWTIMEVLAAFVRGRMRYTTIMLRLSERAYFLWLQAGRPEGRPAEFWDEAVRLEGLEQTSTDIDAILTVIKRRNKASRQREADKGWRFDLNGTYLIRADISEAHLERAQLRNAHLEGAILARAHLKEAQLRNAHLEGAILAGAQLDGADLRGAHLERALLDGAHLERARLGNAHLEKAQLRNAHLEGARLRNAHLEGADLRGAHLEGAILAGAHLDGADLRVAHLQGADLQGAHLEGAILGPEGSDLEGAHLEGADLEGAHLEGAYLATAKGLVQDQITRASGNSETILPQGLTRPEHWARVS
jgi:uncharacterized protein YjbI with pentapeptide repeats